MPAKITQHHRVHERHKQVVLNAEAENLTIAKHITGLHPTLTQTQKPYYRGLHN